MGVGLRLACFCCVYFIGLSTASTANIIYCALVTFGAPLALIFVKNFIYAPAKVRQKLENEIREQQIVNSQLERQVKRLLPKSEEKQAILDVSKPKESVKAKSKIKKERQTDSKKLEGFQLAFDNKLKEIENIFPREKEEIKKPLQIELDDIFLATIHDYKNFSMFYITIVLTITNIQIEKNIIKRCVLFVEKETGTVEFKPNDNDYLKRIISADSDKTIRKDLQTIVFEQGIPQVYTRSFFFKDDDSIYYDEKASLDGKPFILQLTDSYNNHYEVSGRTPQDFLEKRGFIRS